jgi:hypothetical protein
MRILRFSFSLYFPGDADKPPALRRLMKVGVAALIWVQRKSRSISKE